MLRDAGGVSWCQRNHNTCMSLDLISLLTLTFAGGYTLVNRKLYVGKSCTHETPLLHTAIVPKTISAVRMLKYLALQLIQICMLGSNLIQSMAWLLSNQMNYYFGSIYLIDTAFWGFTAWVLYLDYTRLHRLSKIIRVIWIVKLLNIAAQFILISIGSHQTDDNALEYQLYLQLSNLISLIVLNIMSAFIRSFHQEQAEYSLITNQVNEEYVVKQYATDTRPLFIDQLSKIIKTYDEEPSVATEEPTRQNTLFQHEQDESTESLGPSILTDHSVTQISFQTPSFQTPSFLIPTPENEQPRHRSVSPLQPKQEALIQQLKTTEVKQEKVVIDDFRIYEIRVTGIALTRKFNKKTTVYTIVSRLSTGDAKAHRSFREFRMLQKHMAKQYPFETFPTMPSKKNNNEILDETEIKARQASFTAILQCYANKGLTPEFLRSFIYQKSSRRESSNSLETPKAAQATPPKDTMLEVAKEEPLEDIEDVYEEVMRNRFNSLAIKRVINQLKASPPTQAKVPIEEPPALENQFEFKISEIQNRNGAVYYKLVSYFNGRVTATVYRRYKEFKALNKHISEGYTIQTKLPNEAAEDMKATQGRQMLQLYINELYENPDVKIDTRFKSFLGI